MEIIECCFGLSAAQTRVCCLNIKFRYKLTLMARIRKTVYGLNVFAEGD